MSNARNTVTGRVTATEHVSTSMYGNPAYNVTLDNGETYRTMDNAMLAYAITNPEYRDHPHVFTLTRAGRIRSAKPLENTDTLDTWDTDPLYTVYALTDGAGIVEDIYDGDDIEEARRMYDLNVSWEYIARSQYAERGEHYPTTSVHLYEPHYGIMHAETTIEAT